MATDLNRISIIGRITRDPELKYTTAGSSMATFSIANNKSFLHQGEKRESVSFFQCVCWGKRGEAIVQYCRKGHRIALEGRLTQRTWEDSEGRKRYLIEINVYTFQFLQQRTNVPNQDPQAEEDSGVPPDFFDIPDTPDENI